jgi:hypothetical protein
MKLQQNILPMNSTEVSSLAAHNTLQAEFTFIVMIMMMTLWRWPTIISLGGVPISKSRLAELSKY